jgi:hypothetical protein
MAGIPAPIALFAAAGVSLTASTVTIFDQRRRAEENPYSYLLSMEKVLGK